MNPVVFLAALGVIFLHHLFFMTLTFKLGAFFNGRSPVIGMPILLLAGGRVLINYLPVLRCVLPWNLVVDVGGYDAAVVALLSSQPIQPFIPTLVGVAVECILFILIAV